MARDTDRYIDAVAKLIELTQNGEIKWSTDPYSVSAESYILPSQSATLSMQESGATAFYASYKSRRLKLRRLDLKQAAIIGSGGKKSLRSDSLTVLEFIDSSGRSIWQFPSVAPLDDLFRAAQFQVAGVNEFLDELLKDEWDEWGE